MRRENRTHSAGPPKLIYTWEELSCFTGVPVPHLRELFCEQLCIPARILEAALDFGCEAQTLAMLNRLAGPVGLPAN